jgi:pimeloyl-ACP methyl ester carboxylesterase
MRLMEAHGVQRMNIVGISYGGFVGYSLAAQFPENVEKLVLCCAGVCLEEKDMEDGLFKVPNLEEATGILIPQTPEKLKELIRFSFVKPIKGVPSFFLWDFIDVSFFLYNNVFVCLFVDKCWSFEKCCSKC